MSSWLWPDQNIGKRRSRELREEHNKLVNAYAELRTAVDGLLSIERDWRGNVYVSVRAEEHCTKMRAEALRVLKLHDTPD